MTFTWKSRREEKFWKPHPHASQGPIEVWDNFAPTVSSLIFNHPDQVNEK
jgi:hypothetical protein